MRDFRYVYYGKIDIKLDSFLHIGGEPEDSFALATDGRGDFILPASGIAGAIKAFVNKKDESYVKYLGEASDTNLGESVTYIYDGICKDVVMENRKGIRIDGKYGVTQNGSLHSIYYIGQGMKSDVKIQAFLKDKDELYEFDKLFKMIQNGIYNKQITLGAKKSNGAGVFQIENSGSTFIDMSTREGLDMYLTGVDKVFDSISMSEPNLFTEYENATTFCIKAEITDGLIVKNPGTKGDVSDAVSISKQLEGEEVYYIPGSTIKGIIRNYSEKVFHYYNKGVDRLSKLFGGQLKDNNKATGKAEYSKYRSHLLSQDAIIGKVKDVPQVVVNRIKIDRWLGSNITGAKMDQCVIATKEGKTFDIEVRVDSCNDEKDEKVLKGLVFLAMRDMAMGLLPIGSNSGIGFGRLRSKAVIINGESIEINQDTYSLNTTSEQEALIQSWLKEVESY